MSILCQTFVQNAWRSDLCSNCFKSLDDHSEGTAKYRDRTNHRYVPQAASLYQRPQWRLSDPVYERVSRRDFGSQTPPKGDRQKGILIKDPDKRLRSRPSVDFASEEALVIGYGGNDYDSDVSPWEMGSDDGSIDFDILDDTDEDRNITKLTKNNTQFNSSNQNLLVSNKNEKTLKIEHEKQIIIKNNNNNKVSEKPPEKSLSITYNDIQTDKIVSHYYYPSTTESLKSYIHNNSDNNKELNTFKNNNSVNLIENYKVGSFKHESVNICEENCKNLLSEDFSPLNTRTFSFVSELNKNKSFEHSSDSDYSTCRLTAGDSTDSESFHDAEESRIEPCSSFLHGNYPKSLSVVRDKKYDGSSSTSGDVSNLSDDSDTHESTKKIVYKSKSSSKNSKSPPGIQDNKSSKELVTISTSQQTTQISMSDVKTIPVRLKESTNEIQEPIPTLQTNENRKSQSFEICTEALVEDQNEQYTRVADAVNTSIESRLKNAIQSDPKNNPVTSKTLPTSIDEGIDSSSNSINHTKSASSNKQINGSSDVLHKKLRKSLSADNKSTSFTNSLPANDGVIQNDSLVEKHIRFSDEVNDCEASPDTIAQRQSKLAALALELELARRDSLRPNNVNAEFAVQMSPLQIKDVCNAVLTPSNPVKDVTPSPSKLPETPTKTKKNRFSLKKLLKRNKDSGNLTPTGQDTKAWKKQTFDRSRLSLEIVHPMDLPNDTSGESTPTDDSHYAVSNHPSKSFFRTGYNRARSLSALPQVTGESSEQSMCSLLDCRKVETLPARKAGTVAERKKNRPSLVRTPSCSALPSRPQPPEDRSPPPKPPPPPPKYKIQQPPPPPPHPIRCPKANYPARPPPPKIPEVKSRNSKKNPPNEDKEYANLGDIRSQLMPKKPDRASALSVSRENEEGMDHYTYLDDVQGSRCMRKPWMDLQESYSAIAAANYDSLAEIITSSMNDNNNNWKLSGKSLKFKDFVLEEEEHQIVLRNRIVCNAVYKNPAQERIMLLIIPRDTLPTRHPTRYPVLASFVDYLPKEFLMGEAEFAAVYILQRSHLSTLHQFSSIEVSDQHIQLRNYCFILLQLIHALKGLQAEGFEEVNFDLKRLILISTHEDKPPTFILLPEDKTYLTLCETSQTRKTLCQAILETLYHFLNIDQMNKLKDCFVNGKQLAQPVAHTFSAIAQALTEEKASSLTQAKGLLEYMLWGPVDVTNTDDVVLQRWLDLQRAQMLKSTISQLQGKEMSMHVFEEYQLVFLLQASVKSLKNVISKL